MEFLLVKRILRLFVNQSSLCFPINYCSRVFRIGLKIWRFRLSPQICRGFFVIWNALFVLYLLADSVQEVSPRLFRLHFWFVLLEIILIWRPHFVHILVSVTFLLLSNTPLNILQIHMEHFRLHQSPHFLWTTMCRSRHSQVRESFRVPNFLTTCEVSQTDLHFYF